MLRDQLATSVLNLGLATAARPKAKARGPKAGDIGAEVEQLALELYLMLAARRIAVTVLDRCAAEIPAITGDWYDLGRDALVDLWTDYLLGRQRQVASTVDPAVLARTIVELIALWAVKMPWDPAPRLYSGDHGKSCATMIRAVVTGAPSSPPDTPPRPTPAPHAGRTPSTESAPANPATRPAHSVESSGGHGQRHRSRQRPRRLNSSSSRSRGPFWRSASGKAER